MEQLRVDLIPNQIKRDLSKGGGTCLSLQEAQTGTTSKQIPASETQAEALDTFFNILQA